jgi:hypothetical protein
MKRFSLIQLTLALACLTSMSAQDLDAVSTGVSTDLQKALGDLTAARKEVEQERLPWRASWPSWSKS